MEDNHILAVVKPGGVLVQGDDTGDPTLLDAARAYLKEKYNKPGNVFVGLVHRLDRPASGIVILARTSKAASRLTREFSARRTEKTYLAVVEGRVEPARGVLEGHIERTHLRSRLADKPGPRSKEATLSWALLDTQKDRSLLEVHPLTGRHHQIRLQLSAMGHPIVGDLKYGAPAPLPDKTIALHAVALAVKHPTRDEVIELVALPPSSEPWTDFTAAIRNRFQ